MVGDDAERNVGFFILAVLHARRILDSLHDVSDGIHLKEVVDPLHKAGKALKPHSGVDIGLCKAGIVVVPVVVELRENKVPELHEPVAVTSRLTVGRAAAELLAAIEIYLGAGSAGTGAVLPEVILLAEPDDV